MAATWQAIQIIRSITSWSRRKTHRHCERSEAIHRSAKKVWIASFASLLAMTKREDRSNHVSGRRIGKEKNQSRCARQARRRPMPVRQGRLRDRRAGALGLARSFAVEPPRAWRGLCNLCRKLAQTFSYHQGQDQPHAL